MSPERSRLRLNVASHSRALELARKTAPAAKMPTVKESLLLSTPTEKATMAQAAAAAIIAFAWPLAVIRYMN